MEGSDTDVGEHAGTGSDMKPSCHSRIAHGSGHQSTSQCEVEGDHDIHRIVSIGRLLEWQDRHIRPENGLAFTGYFDESPEVQETS